MNTNFHNNKIPKENYQYFLSVILIDFVFRTGKNYYPQVFLEECKYVIKEKKIHNYFIDDVAIYSDSDGQTLLEKIQMEKNYDYGKNSDEAILKKIQATKNSDEENSDKGIFDQENKKKNTNITFKKFL